jgi:hypothetical protein
MIGQILSNNNEICYSNFSHTFRKVNTPHIEKLLEQQIYLISPAITVLRDET